ncbi:rod shape-determining protein MreC [Clostridium sp. USBA 49]|jgi:rod shape-determining protein MreC|uniref:rod shape-determining protein MreC n=1 Tax=Clostridium TaxID=1485 RepID=UPI000999F5CD|nr:MULTISPECIES: rod shape-determining protein MreC [Clostridium]SKA75307.1 rod shape-determining protein MreC [Clostridium sp. USBA 49]
MKLLKNKLTVIIIILSVSFLILIGLSVKRENVTAVENGIGSAINLIQGSIYKVGNSIKETVGSIFKLSSIKKENEELREKNNELERKLLEYNSLLKENQRLREALNFVDQRSEYSYIGCNIIGKSGGNFLDGFIIDKGTKDNIKKGMVVITSRGLVGQVTKTASNWSLVNSISNENIAVSGIVESTNETGIVKGYTDSENTLLAKLYYLPQDSQIKKGDIVLTSGYGNFYPKGIRIGEVIDIEEDKGKIMKNAIIKPYVDFNKLEELLIVMPKEIRDIKY